MTSPLLQVEALRTAISSSSGVAPVVDGMSFEIQHGETLAIVGESGCGKSMAALSLMRLLPDVAQIVGGRVRLSGVDLLGLPESQMRDVRGRRMAMIFQEPATSLNPVMTVGEQIDEVLRRHFQIDGTKARRRSIELLELVGLPSPVHRASEYPFQLSGGMKQRVMIAIALAGEPDLLIADEPTTALDVTIQAQVLELLREQQRKRDMGMLLITHDLGIVAQTADRVAVMYAGQIVEISDRSRFFSAPRHPYSDRLFKALPGRGTRQQLLSTIPGAVPVPEAMPQGCRFADRCEYSVDICRAPDIKLQAIAEKHWVRCVRAVELGPFASPGLNGVVAEPRRVDEEVPIRYLEVRELKVHFPVRRGILRRTVGHIKAVDGVSLAIPKGKTLALVGESGCGKTTAGKAIVQLIPPTSGEVTLDGNRLDLLRGDSLRMQRRNFQIIFQDPFSSLNPRMRVGELLAEGQVALGRVRDQELLSLNSRTLLEQVGLSPTALTRYPHEFSGGQRQRIAIARALAVRPGLLVCDEPTSALDVSVQAQILNLLTSLQQKLGLTYLFITHNIAVVDHIADEVAVMYLGRIVEKGPTQAVLKAPAHPYTVTLLSSVPSVNPSIRTPRVGMPGEMPSAVAPPPGCHFHPRCGAADDRCRQVYPPAEAMSDGRTVACWKPISVLRTVPADKTSL